MASVAESTKSIADSLQRMADIESDAAAGVTTAIGSNAILWDLISLTDGATRYSVPGTFPHGSRKQRPGMRVRRRYGHLFFITPPRR